MIVEKLLIIYFGARSLVETCGAEKLRKSIKGGVRKLCVEGKEGKWEGVRGKG